MIVSKKEAKKMAKKRAIAILRTAKVFINEFDDAIEKDVYMNADRIESDMATKQGYLLKAHQAILEALALESSDDSRYFDYREFEKMVLEKVSLRRERREKAEREKKPTALHSEPIDDLPLV